MKVNDTLKQKKEQASKLVQEIQNEYDSILEVEGKVKALLNSVSKDDKEYKKIISSLKNIHSNTEVAIAKFKEDKDKITKQLRDANTFYNKRFIPISSKFEDPNTGVSAKIRESNKIQTELNKIKKDVASKYDEVKKLITKFRQDVRSLRAIDASIRNLHKSSTENKSNSDKLLITIKDIEKKSVALFDKIKSVEEKSQVHLQTIIELETNSKDNFEKITNNLEVSEDKKERILEIYNIAADTGRSGEFNNRRSQLKKEVKKWEITVLVVSIILVLSVFGLFAFQLFLLNWEISKLEVNFYLRFIMLSPVVYYLVFSAGQHRKVQRLYDKYNFKTTLAMSIKHHIELLLKQEQFLTKEANGVNKILEFVLDAFAKIYNEPYSDDDYKMKIKLANIELDIENKLTELVNKATSK